jgi:hypothetical protein
MVTVRKEGNVRKRRKRKDSSKPVGEMVKCMLTGKDKVKRVLAEYISKLKIRGTTVYCM